MLENEQAQICSHSSLGGSLSLSEDGFEEARVYTGAQASSSKSIMGGGLKVNSSLYGEILEFRGKDSLGIMTKRRKEACGGSVVARRVDDGLF